MSVHFDFCHNHPILAGDVLRHRDVGPEARERVSQLLQDNHSPLSALEVLKYDLQAAHPDDYVRLCADRYHCPDLKWCYRYVYNDVLLLFYLLLALLSKTVYLLFAHDEVQAGC